MSQLEQKELSDGLSAEQIARSLPCWAADQLGPVNLVSTQDKTLAADLELGSGRTNQNFVAISKDNKNKEPQRFFVRIGSDIGVYTVTRAKEQAAQRAAAAAGIAPKVFYSSSEAMVTAFCNGKVLTDTQFKAACGSPWNSSEETAATRLLQQVATAFRRVHAITPPSELVAARAESVWAPRDMWSWLTLAEKKGFSRLPLLTDVRALIGRLEEVAGTAGPVCFCHFDLLPDNLILSPPGPNQAVSVIDFEYAAVGQPLMDLAVASMGCSLSAEEEANLLGAYFQTAPTQALRRSFAALKVLACLRETLWGVVAEVSGESALPMEEAIAYTNQNWEKLVRYRKQLEQAQKAED